MSFIRQSKFHVTNIIIIIVVNSKESQSNANSTLMPNKSRNLEFLLSESDCIKKRPL